MPREIDRISDGFRFTECPRWHDGHLYFVDVHDACVYRIDSNDVTSPYLNIDHPSGLGWTPEGDLLVVSSHACELHRFDGKTLQRAADLKGMGHILSNDMVVDRTGGAYIGGLGEGLAAGQLPAVPILYVPAKGAPRVAATGLHCPNGMALTPDGKTLIVAETFAYRLTAFDVAADGSLSGRRVWAQLGTGRPATSTEELKTNANILPDGIALDSSGAVWVADCRGKGALRVAEGGRVLDTVALGSDTAIAVALGGADRCSLYMMVGPAFDRIPSILAGRERLYSVQRTTVTTPGAAIP